MRANSLRSFTRNEQKQNTIYQENDLDAPQWKIIKLSYFSFSIYFHKVSKCIKQIDHPICSFWFEAYGLDRDMC